MKIIKVNYIRSEWEPVWLYMQSPVKGVYSWAWEPVLSVDQVIHQSGSVHNKDCLICGGKNER